MPLAPGRDLSHYRLLERIGEGGMGVVWKATDTTLGRSVAIKVLPEAFADDPERMARFEREARLLASLNHPHIAAIYGVGSAEGVRFLAMELVEGNDLAVRLAQGPLPMGEVLELARQIAEALEAAHEKGVIHRDLKPANVKLTADGQVKLLDFGLAKALEGEATTTSSSPSAHSPTLTTPMTAAHVILGTAAYMSPEQARGKPLDRRVDIWAFGCVLYECLTGRAAFAGETVSDTIARILEREPDVTALPAKTPPRVRELLRRCLEKDARKRLRDIGDARLELDDVLAAGLTASGALTVPVESTTRVARRSGSATLAWGVAAVGFALAAIALFFPGLVRRSPRLVPARTTVASPAGMEISTNPADTAISPDGTSLVFAVGYPTGKFGLWLRSLDSLEARPIAGAEITNSDSPGLPFWSPDGKSIGFFGDDKLKTIPISGGSPQILASVSNARGGTWNRDGVILFAPSSQGPPFRVSASGGDAVQVTAFDASRNETAHRFPRFLPDGRHYQFITLPGHDGKLDTWIGELGSEQRTPVVSAACGALYASPGYMIFVRDQSLVAQAFDLDRLRLEGEPARIGDAPEDLRILGTIPATASENGILVYPTSTPIRSHLTWFGRDGKAQGDLPVPEGDYREIVFSPDNRQIALLRHTSPASNDIWIADAVRGTMARLTTDGTQKFSLHWSGNGNQVAYTTQGEFDFYQRSISGSGEAQLLFASASAFKNLSQLTRDGSYVVFDDLGRTTQRDLWVLPLEGDREPVLYLGSPFNEGLGSVSPDGQWMLYVSDESGQPEVYVQSFPTPGTKVRVSTDGGFLCAWRDDGAEILYASLKGPMSVSVGTGATFTAGEPKLMMELPKETGAVGVTTDFKRFLLAMAAGERPGPSLTLLTNWTSLLER